jgi:hypothetical protein
MKFHSATVHELSTTKEALEAEHINLKRTLAELSDKNKTYQ